MSKTRSTMRKIKEMLHLNYEADLLVRQFGMAIGASVGLVQERAIEKA